MDLFMVMDGNGWHDVGFPVPTQQVKTSARSRSTQAQ
jgi:hypothetical protein